MAYDQALAQRIRTILVRRPNLEEMQMFGGLAFLVDGHIVACAYRDGRLLITCSREDYPDLMEEPGARPMLRKGKAVSGWVVVEAEAVARDEALERWVARGLAHSLTKPAKD